MVFRLHIALLLALAALFFGARVGAQRAYGLNHYGATHCVTDCSIVSIELTDLPAGCLPDPVKRWTPAIICILGSLFTLKDGNAPRRAMSSGREIRFNVTQAILSWGVASGVLAQPPDSCNNKEQETYSAALA